MIAVALIAFGVGWIGGVWLGQRTGYAAGLVDGWRGVRPPGMRRTIHTRHFR